MSYTPAEWREVERAHNKLKRALGLLAEAADLAKHPITDRAANVNTVALETIAFLQRRMSEEGLS